MDTQYNNVLNYAGCRYAECRYAECRCAGSHGALKMYPTLEADPLKEI
jgi:hypothetical protein